MIQMTQQPLIFDGETIDHERDSQRLGAQLARVKAVMDDGQWRTLAQICACTGDVESGVSARLRDLRKARFGGHTVNRRYIARGTFEYQLVKSS